MTAYRGRRPYGAARHSAPLTPPADLVGQLIRWQPKGADGKRRPAVFGTCTAYDADARTLTVEVSQEVSPWQPNPVRVVTVPLSSGPFTVASSR